MAQGETPRVTRVYEAEQTRTSASIERVWRKHHGELPLPASQRVHPNIGQEEDGLRVKRSTATTPQAAQPQGCSDLRVSTKTERVSSWDWPSLSQFYILVGLRYFDMSSTFYVAIAFRTFSGSAWFDIM